MKLADTFVKFFHPNEVKETKFVSLEQLLVFKVVPKDDNGVEYIPFDHNLYLFIKESKQYVKMVSEEKYWEMYKLSVDCS
jgi:hypothetical protein